MKERYGRGLVGNTHPNHILDTGLYEVRFDNGKTAAFSTNIFTENIYKQVNKEGQSWAMIDEIVEHHKPKDAILNEE